MIEQLKNYHEQEKLMALIILSLFVPMIPSVIIMLIVLIIALRKGYLQSAYHHTKASRFVLIFGILEMIVSLFYRNFPGFGFCFLIVIFFSVAIFFREYLTEAFFEKMTKAILILSVIAALAGFIQYIVILQSFHIHEPLLVVFNTPMHRINAFYFNSNYYAMMINFFIGIGFYKILKAIQKKRVKTILGILAIILINMFALYLSGCRTAWPALALGLIVMLFFAKFYKLFAGIAVLSAGGAGLMATHPQLISRFSNIHKYIGVRRNIWRVAILNIKSHPLFGEGPMTYWHIYKNYKHAHPTQHAHNVFIDPVLSFGIVGICTIAPYFITSIAGLHRMHKKHCNDALVGLIIGMIVMTLVHGLLDYTIFFVHTATLFLIIMGSFDMYTKDTEA